VTGSSDTSALASRCEYDFSKQEKTRTGGNGNAIHDPKILQAGLGRRSNEAFHYVAGTLAGKKGTTVAGLLANSSQRDQLASDRHPARYFDPQHGFKWLHFATIRNAQAEKQLLQ
jgi:hypothetical protein